MLAIERQRIIREILQRDGVARNADLREMLHVSTVTIRADLRTLTEQGVCELIWGGAVLKRGDDPDTALVAPLKPRPLAPAGSTVNLEAKQRIGERAAQLVKSGQTIIVDSGSTSAIYAS
jgi:DeoR family transcriptional regulator of aga operon